MDETQRFDETPDLAIKFVLCLVLLMPCALANAQTADDTTPWRSVYDPHGYLR